MIFVSRGRAAMQECKNASVEEMRSFMENDFRHKFLAERGLLSSGLYDLGALNFQVSRAAAVKASGMDWTASIDVKVKGENAEHRYLIYYTCGHGLEYSGPLKSGK
ncbi:hypothetical protein C7Y68_19300 [Paracidovorax avenae]|nr:hypothetical protein [Paracidovorax avenae]AVT07476.1 hypothetical protein C8248_16930 [Paracidovorax avenae]AVT21900.1 hypothetical protein C7Y68_19300 [Paracidovorax avenae]